MPTLMLSSDRLKVGMKLLWRRRWVRIQSVQFGPQTTVTWENGAVTADPTDQFEVLLTRSGGYDFSEHVPEPSALA